jgi:protein gp37
MMTSIEWTEETWNPFVGCSIKSAGCRNCYAMRLAPRLVAMGQVQYQGTTGPKGAWTGTVNRSTESVIERPLRTRKPTVWFVNSMSDFWHENALDDWRAEALDIIEATPRHIYQILTKRPENIAGMLDRMGRRIPNNVWLGCTVEDRRVIDRIDVLRSIPAKIRFLSVEPMIAALGPVDLDGIHWVITGGESGYGSRPISVDWVREVRDQCARVGVAFFHKQWGQPEFNPLAVQCPPDERVRGFIKRVDPHGKGGALLDGRLWWEMPGDVKIRGAA